MAKSSTATKIKAPSATPATTKTERLKLVPILNNMGPMGIPLPAIMVEDPTGKKDGKGNPRMITVSTSAMLHLPHGLSYQDPVEWERAEVQENVKLQLATRIRGTKAEEWRDVPKGQRHLVRLDPVDAKSPLGKLPEKDAIDFLADVTDPAVLGQLIETEARPLVLRAIRAQKETIEKKGVGALGDVEDRAEEDED